MPLVHKPAVVILRQKLWNGDIWRGWGADLVTQMQSLSLRVWLQGSLDLAQSLAVDGWHLDSQSLEKVQHRPERWQEKISASLHDVAQLPQAQALGCDALLYSPILPTASHADLPAKGWDGLLAFVGEARIPVYALGGVDIAQIALAQQHWAQSVATTRGIA